jgi:hypothetical protein
MSTEEEGIMELTEFIHLSRPTSREGGLLPWLMNSALPAGTLQANVMEMKHLAKKRSNGS